MKIDKEGKIEDPFLRGFAWGFQHFRNYQINANKWPMDLKAIFSLDREDYKELAGTSEFDKGITAALQSAWGK